MTTANALTSNFFTESPELGVFESVRWAKKPKSTAKSKTLKAINSQIPFDRDEVLRRAEANTVKLTGRPRL